MGYHRLDSSKARQETSFCFRQEGTHMPVLIPRVFVVVLCLHISTGDFICAMCVLCVCVRASLLCILTVTPACLCRQRARGSMGMLHICECTSVVQRSYEHNLCVPTAICVTLGFRKGERSMTLSGRCQAGPPSMRQVREGGLEHSVVACTTLGDPQRSVCLRIANKSVLTSQCAQWDRARS